MQGQVTTEVSAEQQSPLQRYKCHKEVEAFRIREILSTANIGEESDGSAILTADNGGRLRVSPEYMQKHRPQIGGYFVLYDDGYRSFSPAKAFDDGYRLMQFGSGTDSNLRSLDIEIAADGFVKGTPEAVAAFRDFCVSRPSLLGGH